MMMEKRTAALLLIFVGFVLVVALALGIGGFTLSKIFSGGQTVIGVSQITYTDATSSWTVPVAVTGLDNFYFASDALTQASGGKQQAQASIGVSLSQLPPYCNYTLDFKQAQVGGILGFGAKYFSYYIVQKPTQEFSPYQLVIFKNTATKSYQSTYTITPGSDPTTRQFPDPEGGAGFLTINNLGALQVNNLCPDASNLVLVPKGDGTWQLITLSGFQNILNDIKNDWNKINILLDPGPQVLASGAQYLWGNYFSPSIQTITPPQWTNCAVVQNPSVSTAPYQLLNFSILTAPIPSSPPASGLSCWSYVGTQNAILTYQLPQGSTNAFVTVSMDTKFADAVVVQKMNGVPYIAPFTLASIPQTGTGTTAITITNVGTTADVFNVQLQSPDGLTTFSTNLQNTPVIQPGTSASVTFGYYAVGTNPGAKVCAVATSVGSGAQGNSPVCNTYSQTVNPAIQPGSIPGGTTQTPTGYVAVVPSQNISSVTCPAGYLFAPGNNSCYLPAMAPAFNLTILGGGAPTCASGYLLNQSSNTCTQVGGAPGGAPLTCAQKVDAQACPALDISCPVSKSIQKIGCSVQDVIAAFLGASIILVLVVLGGVLLVWLVISGGRRRR